MNKNIIIGITVVAVLIGGFAVLETLMGFDGEKFETVSAS